MLQDDWLGQGDIGLVFRGIPLSREEYELVEDLYVLAAVRFATEVGVREARVAYVGHQADGFELTAGQTLSRADIGPVVRGNLRGQLDCALEATNAGFRLAFGYDLYMYVACVAACDRAAADVAASGLWLEDGVSHPFWDEDDD